MKSDVSVLMFATNKHKYVQFALNCAESILLHNEIQVFIVSDLPVAVPFRLQKFVSIVKVKPTHLSLGLGIKIYMDEYVQTENTLFVDADCLCYASLVPMFAAFNDKNVSVVGTVVNSADWCGGLQAGAIEKEFGITQLPRFNAGVVYLEKSTTAVKIFDYARRIVPNYDKLGFQRNNGTVNEEILIAIAMVKHGETPIQDDGRYMTDLSTDSHPRKLNVLKGERVLNNPMAGEPKHRPWYPEGDYSPIIIHFGGSNLGSYIYRSQVLLLQFYKMHVGKSLASWVVDVFFHMPVKSLRWCIDLFRNKSN